MKDWPVWIGISSRMPHLFNFRMPDYTTRGISIDPRKHDMLDARNMEPVATTGKVPNVRFPGTEVFHASEAQLLQLRGEFIWLKKRQPRLTAGCCCARGHSQRALVIASQQILRDYKRERDLSSRAQRGHLLEGVEDRLSREVLGDAQPGEERRLVQWTPSVAKSV